VHARVDRPRTRSDIPSRRTQDPPIQSANNVLASWHYHRTHEQETTIVTRVTSSGSSTSKICTTCCGPARRPLGMARMKAIIEQVETVPMLAGLSHKSGR
jgi:hypothetical protein